MAKTATIGELLDVLRSGRFDQLIGVVEDECLECKSSPYRLENDHDKMELGKDVSGLANAKGGIVLIGVQTEKEPDHFGDEVRRVHPFASGLVNAEQYHQVLLDWVYPPIKGLEIVWLPSADQPSEGLVVIVVPQEASQDRPYLVKRVVDVAGKTVGYLVGYFERTRASIRPTSAEQLRDRFRDGLRFWELGMRLGNIEETLGRLAASPPERKPSVTVEIIRQRVARARTVANLDGHPTLFLASWPTESASLTELLSRSAKIVQELENPPRLRDSGFDLGRAPSALVDGQLRRCLTESDKVLELWRDGTLIFVAPGDDWHLCWGMRSGETTGLRINNRALAETTYLFVALALKLYDYSEPPPKTLIFQLGLIGMTVNERPCTLSPYPPRRFALAPDTRSAPGSDKTVQVQAERTGATPEIVSFELLAELYAWFTFDQEQIPYADAGVSPPRIDPDKIAKH